MNSGGEMNKIRIFLNKNKYFDDYTEILKLMPNEIKTITISLGYLFSIKYNIAGILLNNQTFDSNNLTSDLEIKSRKNSNIDVDKLEMGFTEDISISRIKYKKRIDKILNSDNWIENLHNLYELRNSIVNSNENDTKNDHKVHNNTFDKSKSVLLLGLYLNKIEPHSKTDMESYLSERIIDKNFRIQYASHNYYYNYYKESKKDRIGMDVFCLKCKSNRKGKAFYFSFGEWIGIVKSKKGKWYKTKVLKIVFKKKSYHGYPEFINPSNKFFDKYKNLVLSTKLDKNEINKLSDLMKYRTKRNKFKQIINENEYYNEKNYQLLKNTCCANYVELRKN